MMIKHIMPRDFATIAIINMEEIKSHGTVLMRNSMLVECVKIATSTCTIRKNGKKLSTRIKKMNLLPILKR